MSYQAKGSAHQDAIKPKNTSSRPKIDQESQSYVVKKHTRSKTKSSVHKPQKKIHQKIQEKLAHKLVSKAKQKKAIISLYS